MCVWCVWGAGYRKDVPLTCRPEALMPAIAAAVACVCAITEGRTLSDHDWSHFEDLLLDRPTR